MALVKPGEFITTKCGRCNDVTGHIVMVIVDGVILKVECQACGSVHKYREARLPGARKESPAVKRVRSGQTRDQAVEVQAGAGQRKAPRAAAAKIVREAARLETAWQEAMVRHGSDLPKAYSMQTPFAAGDFLDHETFGRGEVIRVMRPNKMDVLFQDGVKTLRCTPA